MRLTLFIAAVFVVFSSVFPSVFAQECLTPFNNMHLSSSRTLCHGEYNVENIIVGGSGVVIECNATLLRGGQQNIGISVEYAQDITIRGCTLQGYEVGISAKGSENVVLENNFLLNNKIGIAEQGSSTLLRGNTFEGSARQDFMSVESLPGDEEQAIGVQQPSENRSQAFILKKQVMLINPDASASEIERQVEGLLRQADLSQELLDIQRTVAIDEETKTTTVTLSIFPKQPLKDVAIYEGIPKCLSEYLSQVVFSDSSFETIEEDPLIMWTFSKMSEKSKLSYMVERAVSRECTDLLAGFGIASPAALSEKIEKPLPKKGMGGGIGFGVLVVLFLGIIFFRMASKAKNRR